MVDGGGLVGVRNDAVLRTCEATKQFCFLLKIPQKKKKKQN